MEWERPVIIQVLKQCACVPSRRPPLAKTGPQCGMGRTQRLSGMLRLEEGRNSDTTGNAESPKEASFILESLPTVPGGLYSLRLWRRVTISLAEVPHMQKWGCKVACEGCRTWGDVGADVGEKQRERKEC